MYDRRTLLRGLGAALPAALLAACAARVPPPEPPAEAPLPDVRRVVLVHAPSGERADVVYFSSQRYDPRALQTVSRVMRDRSTGESAAIDPLLLDFLFDLLSRTGLPPSTEVQVLSGFRSAKTNAQLIKQGRQAARESFHLTGKALDFRVPVLPGPALAEIAKTMQRGGAAYYPSTGHTHIDVGPVRTWRAR